jgi:hypothetical protein
MSDMAATRTHPAGQLGLIPQTSNRLQEDQPMRIWAIRTKRLTWIVISDKNVIDLLL